MEITGIRKAIYKAYGRKDCKIFAQLVGCCLDRYGYLTESDKDELVNKWEQVCATSKGAPSADLVAELNSIIKGIE